MSSPTPPPKDAQIAVTLSTTSYVKTHSPSDRQRTAMDRALQGAGLPTRDWSLVWGPVTVEENLSFIAKGPAVGSGPGWHYAYAIRGTVLEPWNLIEDLLDGLGLNDLPWGGGGGAQIADGMRDGWKNLTAAKDGGVSALEFLQGMAPGSRLIVTGHSLGAMLASVMAVYLRQELGAEVQVAPYTFAAPTAGNEDFAKLYAGLFGGAGRYFNCLDIVPKVYAWDDVASIEELYPCPDAPRCRGSLVCEGLVRLAHEIAGHRYFHPPGGTRLEARVYAEKSGSFKNFLKEALSQHHAVHYMYLLGLPLPAIRTFDAEWSPPTVPCPCP